MELLELGMKELWLAPTGLTKFGATNPPDGEEPKEEQGEQSSRAVCNSVWGLSVNFVVEDSLLWGNASRGAFAVALFVGYFPGRLPR
jgi:hypothetical protein